MTSQSSSSMVKSYLRATSQPSLISYDVFLSFRGEDTRDNFTDHLYTALNQAGIRTFRDDDAMDRGKPLTPELKKAIRESTISLIVFSKGYASSTWCLDEVRTIMEKQKTSAVYGNFRYDVLPVFYKVKPSDVRNQRGSFKQAFDKYDDEIKAEKNLKKKTALLLKVSAWRQTLGHAATSTGFVYRDGSESRFIYKIVNAVIKKVDNKALYTDDKLVGMENHVAEIESWLQDPSPYASVLLINGMGGIGKTTIAKIIFNLNFRKYDGSCYLARINDASNQHDQLLRLQTQLFSTILKRENEETIWNLEEGTKKVTNAISNQKVLLILDDVTTSEQLDVLLGPKSFYRGSKVIITTRHAWLLATAFKVPPKVHFIGPLSTDDATELFSLYAFHEHQPTEPFITQSQQFVHHCMGLPLALKERGTSLSNLRTNDAWEAKWRKMEAVPNPEVQKVLKVSYDLLADDMEKDLFLHVACFFAGEQKDYLVKLLTACNLFPVVGIKNLIDRCLIHVEKGRVMMHQLVKEMGREVVRMESPKDPGKRSRLWHHEDCVDVLQDQSGTTTIEGLVIDMQNIKETTSIVINDATMHGKDENADFDIGALEKMRNLMLLQLNYVTIFGECNRLPKKLRLLNWHGFSPNTIRGHISLEKLVVVDMSYSKVISFQINFNIMRSLRILNLSHSLELIETPDFVGLPSLESLILKGCSSLIMVGESIKKLTKLVLLDLTNCSSLRDLPTSLPASLRAIKISGCPHL
ncbi:hypothetical protein LXL04_001270 [Taraxacum kok-saghyz]